MKQLFLLIALLSALTFSANANVIQPIFTISGTTTIDFSQPFGGVTISAASTDCNGWAGVSVSNAPMVAAFEFEIPQACQNLQVTAFKHGYHFAPDSYALFFPTTQINPITHINFQVN